MSPLLPMTLLFGVHAATPHGADRVAPPPVCGESASPSSLWTTLEGKLRIQEAQNEAGDLAWSPLRRCALTYQFRKVIETRDARFSNPEIVRGHKRPGHVVRSCVYGTLVMKGDRRDRAVIRARVRRWATWYGSNIGPDGEPVRDRLVGSSSRLDPGRRIAFRLANDALEKFGEWESVVGIEEFWAPLGETAQRTSPTNGQVATETQQWFRKGRSRGAVLKPDTDDSRRSDVAPKTDQVRVVLESGRLLYASRLQDDPLDPSPVEGAPLEEGAAPQIHRRQTLVEVRLVKACDGPTVPRLRTR